MKQTKRAQTCSYCTNSRQFVGEAEQEKQKTEICDTKADWFVSNGICVDEH